MPSLGEAGWGKGFDRNRGVALYYQVGYDAGSYGAEHNALLPMTRGQVYIIPTGDLSNYGQFISGERPEACRVQHKFCLHS